MRREQMWVESTRPSVLAAAAEAPMKAMKATGAEYTNSVCLSPWPGSAPLGVGQPALVKLATDSSMCAEFESHEGYEGSMTMKQVSTATYTGAQRVSAKGSMWNDGLEGQAGDVKNANVELVDIMSIDLRRGGGDAAHCT